MIRLLTIPEMGKEWPRIAPHLERVLARFDYGSDENDIFADAIQGHRQIWAIGDFDAIAVTQINRLPKFSVLDVSLLAGKGMKEWLPDLVGILTQFAEVNGCKYMDGFGRKGWTKQLEKYGFKPYSYDVRMEI